MNAGSDLRRNAIAALFWSLVQNWGGRALALVVFLALARLLSPKDFGLASSAILIFSIVSLVSELGFSDALIQKREFKDEEAVLPFLVTLGASAVLASVTAIGAKPIAGFIGVGELAPLIVAAAALSPLAVAAGFQDAMYRRALEFRRLAERTLLGGLLGGIAGIAAAAAGFGAWALVIQFAVQTFVSLAWLWSRPVWVPSFPVETGGFPAIARFGLNVAAMRIVDFVTMRTVDFLILAKLGPSTFGLFAVSSRLYQFLMQLLQASISNVGLAALSRVASDEARLGRLFVQTTSLSAMICSPVFFGLAAIAPEVNLVMFGARWTGAEAVMAPLLVVGGIHCLLFGAGAYLTAVGRPGTLFRLMLLKACFVLTPLTLLSPTGLRSMTLCFAAGLLAEAPFTIHAALRSLSLGWRSLGRPVGVPLLACFTGFLGVSALRFPNALDPGTAASAIAYGTVFTVVYAAVTASLAFGQAKDNVRFLVSAIRR